MNELMLDVPKLSMFTLHNENSDYTNGAQQDKNCYMIFVSDHNEDCYFSYAIDSCKDCTDCLNCFECTLGVECTDCSSCYNVAYSQKTHGCRDSYFLSDCKNCQDCLGCYGLRGKKFHIFNQPLSEEEYREKIKMLDLGNYDNVKRMQDTVNDMFAKQQIHQFIDGNNNDNVTGDHIVNCKNSIECYDSADLEDCGYLIFSFKSKDCYDGHVVVDKCELCYETVSTIDQYNTQFTYASYHSKNSMYLDHSQYCQDCFACSGLQKEKYCIFNKKYSKEEYESLREKIIEHMKKTGEWGQMFPSELSPFGYNETVAQEYFPLSKEEVEAKGWKWYDERTEDAAYQGPQIDIPKNINDVKDDIVDKILTSKETGKPYKIIPQELELYRFHKLPIPRRTFNERHLKRIEKRNPRKLWDRNCMKCNAPLKSSYSPDRKEIIYCEKCYLETIY